LNFLGKKLSNKVTQTDQDQEKQLILEVQQGNRQAFDQLMLKYHRRVFNIAFRIFGDYYQADEVAQDVFVRAFKSIRSFKFQAQFMSWLYRITINLCRNRMKKNQKQKSRKLSLDAPYDNQHEHQRKREIADESMAADKAILDKELSTIIQCALNTLEPEFKEIIVLRDIQQLSYEEISQIIKLNLGTVKSRLHRARALLAGRLEEVI
jgi:RNA polymerase sigma-70 factor (ECF subfamily)